MTESTPELVTELTPVSVTESTTVSTPALETESTPEAGTESTPESESVSSALTASDSGNNGQSKKKNKSSSKKKKEAAARAAAHAVAEGSRPFTDVLTITSVTAPPPPPPPPPSPSSSAPLAADLVAIAALIPWTESEAAGNNNNNIISEIALPPPVSWADKAGNLNGSWKTKGQIKNRPKSVKGTNQSGGLKGIAPLPRDYHQFSVTRLDDKTSSDDVTRHLQKEGIQVNDVWMLQSKIKGSKTAKIRVAREHRDRAKCPSLWPLNCRVMDWDYDFAKKNHPGRPGSLAIAN